MRFYSQLDGKRLTMKHKKYGSLSFVTSTDRSDLYVGHCRYTIGLSFETLGQVNEYGT